MLQEVKAVQERATQEVEQAQDLESLERVRIQYLGRKGELTELLKRVGQLDPAERPVLGQAVNAAKQAIQDSIESRKRELEKAHVRQRVETERIDVTLPGRQVETGSFHPVTRLLNRIEDLFTCMGFETASGPEIEDVDHNFEALNIPAEHPARMMHDTFYFDERWLLRTHTSPVQIRVMRTTSPPLRVIAPGRVFRRDSDITHTPMFHQVEGFIVDQGVTFAHLKDLLIEFLTQLFEWKDLPVRFRPSYFPFTEPSAEVDIGCVFCRSVGCRICERTGWLEILGAGMIHPHVFQYCGVDNQQYTGLAFGMGVERLAMLRYGVDDLRLFFENDIRFLEQFRYGGN